jgi:spectinomycin phosphotransferase
MKALPEGFDEGWLGPSLAEGWALEPATIDYAAVGFGSYHWIVSDALDRRSFVTIDDLDHKPWLGDTRAAAFAGLQNALDTAVALRRDCGLEFVVAPLPSVHDESARRIGDRHAISVFPFVDGRAGEFGQELSPAARTEIVRLLVRLHQAAPMSVAPRVDVPLPGRGVLEAALGDLGGAWHGGPYAEPARAWLAEHALNVRHQLREFDRLVKSLVGRVLVVTHGEPHPGNVLRGHDALMLIDWDTVALAPPERDLWMLATPGGGELAQYVDATGQELSADAVSLYRLAWGLGDVAAYVDLFRSAHESTEDNADAWGYLTGSTWLDEQASPR